MHTILFATDGSESSKQALDFAIDLATDAHARLEILSVRPLRAGGRGAPRSPVLEVEQFEGPSQIAAAAANTARAAGVDAHPHAAHGDVVASIADAATTLRADVLVIGSRGLGSISGAMLGSVSHALVRRSPIPVTVVRRTPAHDAATARA